MIPSQYVWSEQITLTKLEAARRQLCTAIELWFADRDPVSVHTLAAAAYEIIHALSKKRNPGRRDLLFDSIIIKDEYRKDWVAHLKKEQNFFKHADRDPDSIIEFSPKFTEFFIMFSILGLSQIGETLDTLESAFMFWLQFHRPKLLKPDVRDRLAAGIPVEDMDEVKRLSKPQFLAEFLKYRVSASQRPRRSRGVRLPTYDTPEIAHEPRLKEEEDGALL
jgi:hypothetical protein